MIFLHNPLMILPLIANWLSAIYVSDQKWNNGEKSQNTLKNYKSKSIYIYCYHPCLYNYTLEILFLLITLPYSLMRYNILDTTNSSATEARKLFKEHWDNIIKKKKNFYRLDPIFRIPLSLHLKTQNKMDGQKVLNDI